VAAKVDVQIIEQALDVVFAAAAAGGAFDVGKDAAQGFVEVVIVTRLAAHIGEQLRGQDVKAFFLDRLQTAEFGIAIA